MDLGRFLFAIRQPRAAWASSLARVHEMGAAHEQVFSPVRMTWEPPTGKSTCPCHPVETAR